MINPNPDNYVTRSPPIIALGATTSAFGVSSPYNYIYISKNYCY